MHSTLLTVSHELQRLRCRNASRPHDLTEWRLGDRLFVKDARLTVRGNDGGASGEPLVAVHQDDPSAS